MLRAPLLLLLLLIFTVPASGTEYNWIGSSGSSWHLSTNWSPEGIPGAADNATIYSSAAAITSSVSVAGLFMDVYGATTLSIASGQTLSVLDIFQVSYTQFYGGSLRIASGCAGRIGYGVDFTDAQLIVDGSLRFYQSHSNLWGNTSISISSGATVIIDNAPLNVGEMNVITNNGTILYRATSGSAITPRMWTGQLATHSVLINNGVIRFESAVSAPMLSLGVHEIVNNGVITSDPPVRNDTLLAFTITNTPSRVQVQQALRLPLRLSWTTGLSM